MEKIIDLINDPLASATLTPEERTIWETVRAETLIAREKLQSLETRIRVLERQTQDEPPLQSLLTRPEFNREVARMLAFDERYGGTSSLLLIDFENLGAIMKTCGRAACDEAVQTLTDALSHNVRRSDILGRLDTETFAIFLARCPCEAAWTKGEKLTLMLKNVLASVPQLSVQPTLSYGAYTFQEKEDLSTGLRAAAAAVTRESAVGLE